MARQASAGARTGKILLVGLDYNQLLEKRFAEAGYEVVAVSDGAAAMERARAEALTVAVVVSSGSLINMAETIFNLRDVNGSIEIMLIVDRLGRRVSRFLRQLIEHPIEGTRILTRRQLQKQLHALPQHSPPVARPRNH
jgi:CheY-like chemotaxis protein